MAGIKISALPAATSAVGTDVFPADQSGPVTRKISFSQVATLFNTNFVQLNPSSNQIITTNSLSLAAGNVLTTLGTFSSGSAAGGISGSFKAFATTAATGGTLFTAANNAGNFENVLTNASTAAARTWTLPDATGTIALTVTTGGLIAVSVAGTTQALSAGNAYIFNNLGATTGTLPLSGLSTIGDVIKIKGRSGAAWIIQANPGQIIIYGSVASSAAGTATSAAGTDSIQLMYISANAWSVDWALSSGIVLT
jgi:hypothetical protein